MDRTVVNVAVAILVIVGVSSSISPALDALYGEIAFWGLIVGLPLGAFVFWIKGVDFGLDREVRESWRQNGQAVQALAEKHTAHPDVAQELAERMLAEKLRQQQLGIAPVPPPKTGT